MGEKTKVKWLSEGTRLIHDSTSFANPVLFPHILRKYQKTWALLKLPEGKKGQQNCVSTGPMLIKPLFLFKTDLVIFWPELNSTPYSEPLCLLLG